MKRAIIILSILTALSLIGMAQGKTDQTMTGGIHNGRGWLQMTYEVEVVYLTGYSDHWLATVDRLKENKRLQR